jgi:hypothetical protein
MRDNGFFGVCFLATLPLLAAGCGDASGTGGELLGRDTGALDGTPASAPDPHTSVGTPGLVEGTTTWVVPTSPNGLNSDQSWFSIAGAPDGNVYLAACDHISNSALFRLTPKTDELGFLGDARSASEAANNWLPGETAEKFHVRPLWFRNRVYVATADYSNQDSGYLAHRGFHWYAYDVPSERFLDLSASEPGGVAAPHISIFSSALDEKRGVIYGLGSPTSHLYRYDVATGTTTDLGRSPLLTREFYNPGRYLWIDSRGRVYFTVATAGTLAPGEPQTPTYVLSWDPVEGWGSEPTWTIAEMLRTGQCSLDKKRCYILDYPLNLYLFDDEARTFTKINKGELSPEHVSTRTRNYRVRSMNLSASEKKLYIINDSAVRMSLFEWDFGATPFPLEIATIAELDDRMDARYTAYTGHDAWDEHGRFHFTGFGGEGVPSTPNVYFTRIDPVRLKAARGLLPGVPIVSLRGAGRGLHLVRTGDRSTELRVIVQANGRDGASYATVTMPAGATVVRVPADVASAAARRHAKSMKVVPDGDTYTVSGGAVDCQ